MWRILNSLVMMAVVLAATITGGARAQDGQQGTPGPAVYAEALGQANLRSGPGIEYAGVGEITAGTRYRVVAQHSYVPWLQIEYPPASGNTAWVYADLVAITGSLGWVPVTGDFPPLTPPASTLTPTRAASATSTPGTPSTTAAPPTAATGSPAPPSATPAGPLAITQGAANIRFGPGIEYAPVVKAEAGESFRILEFHALFPWIHVAVPDSPTGSGWVYREIVDIEGDTSRIPVTSAQQFGLPTLTPTPPTVIVGRAPWNGAPQPSGDLAATLGERMHNYLLEQGFAPYTDRFASVFVLDLQSGDSFTLNGGVAYSGMSLTKIPILAAFFQRSPDVLGSDTAYLVADTMMCSENITTNQLLELMGEGDKLRGAQRVTAFMQRLGLNGTFIMRHYVTDPDEPVVAVGTITTGADQSSARPDLYNQVVPSELGWLLAGVYQCAQNETGLLMERYPNDFDAQKCRKMLYAMDANTINVFLESGVPVGTRVMHKHGWIDDTHGDAGIVIGPEGAYVFVVTLYADTSWLSFERTATVIGELSRMAWNHFNPLTPLGASRAGIVPEVCNARSHPVIAALMSDRLPMPGP